MSDMPERIWAVHHETQGAIRIGEWGDTIRHIGGTEYIRADLALPDDVATVVEEAGEVAKGVAGGPWTYDGKPSNLIVWDGSGNRVCFLAHSNGLDDDRDVATARFIAWCREGVPALTAVITAQAAQIAGLQSLDKAIELVNGVEKSRAEAALAAMAKERDELRAAIFGSPDYDPALRNGNFREMAETMHAANAGGRAALAAERARVAKLVEALEAIAESEIQSFMLDANFGGYKLSDNRRYCDAPDVKRLVDRARAAITEAGQ